MSDTEVKLFLALIGVAGALATTLGSIVAFFWLERRKRFASQLAGLRLLHLMAESVCTALNVDRLDGSEIKIDWLVQHAEGILTTDQAYEVVVALMRLRAKLLAISPDDDRHALYGEADNVRIMAQQALRGHAKPWRKALLATS